MKESYRYIVFISKSSMPKNKGDFQKALTSIFIELFGIKEYALSKLVVTEYIPGRGGIIKTRRESVHKAKTALVFYRNDKKPIRIVKVTGTLKKAKSILKSYLL